MREAAHLTSDEACALSGVSRATLSRTESGTASITVATVRKLLNAYDPPSPMKEALIAAALRIDARELLMARVHDAFAAAVGAFFVIGLAVVVVVVIVTHPTPLPW